MFCAFRFSIILLLFFLSACIHNQNISYQQAQDSILLTELTRSAYKWQEENYFNIPDFDYIINDSIPISVDLYKVNDKIKKMVQANFFTDSFLDNYKQCALIIDSIIKSQIKTALKGDPPDYFSWNVYPWTNTQDFPDNYYQKIILKNLQIDIANNNAIAYWDFNDANINFKHEYKVRFQKVNNIWKIAYLQGFDSVNNY